MIYGPLQVPLICLGLLLLAEDPSANIRSAAALERMDNYAIAAANIMVLRALFTLWIAVAWHRFVLLNEPFSLLPTFRGRRIAAYFGWALGITVFCWLMLAVPLMLVLIFAGDLVSNIMTSAGQGLLLAWLLSVPVFLAWLVILLRLSTALPGVALGEPISLGHIWRQTRGAGLTYLGVLLLTTIVLAIAQIVPTLFSLVSSATGILGVLIYDWFATMLSISVLTTLYGYYIERRPLA
ncbi:hypothetical protein BJF93_10815 [Xaviernesmea oryzae]|uniref:Glycerophosphoryl diester phosphodiesterase membrane domain-containing protein n=1 Tax=Xaviernesmea oryzae TaxID=464029 RepID=A0A1Q9AX87_9HYPH|nr:hypothetical protein [Xaviernesmea oryzae]OLP60055.1 hypothetical protein BJF93_10815 [Xaviernesmea oryzae]